MNFSVVKVFAASLFLTTGLVAFAQNPIVQTQYTADPAPMVYNGKVYLYTSHDEDNSTWFVMNDWKLYTTEDMVNWTDHGAVASYKVFSWAKGDAWAIQCIERNGKFYLYAPVTSKENNKPAIGVAVADSPFGPFIDPLGKPLAQLNFGDIDPTVFVDDDKQAYLYWGNPLLKYVKLNEDMISFNGEINKVPMVEASFGKREGNTERPTLYEEGPWLYKRNNLYYLLWAGGPLPEHIGYSTSKSPLGPWKYEGTIMPAEGGSFTNHPGLVDYKGKTYFFYHNGALPKGGGFNRSVAVDELEFNKDGTIKPLKMGNSIQKSLVSVNPYILNQAETIAWSKDFKASQNQEVGVFITAKKNGAYSQIKSVDFGQDGAKKFTARVGTTHNAPINMEIRIDGLDGKLLGTVKIPRTGGNDRWSFVNLNVTDLTGVHDLYFIVNGKVETDLMYFDYWKFAK